MESVIFSLDKETGLADLLKQLMLKDIQITISEINKEVFSDGEVCVDFKTSVRGKRVYILSSPNTSDKLMQLNMAIDAAKRAAAREIIPIIPYFPYARQDKKDQPRGPIGAKIVAEMIENRGATAMITFDLHSDQIQGFFNIPVMHMEGKYLFDETIDELVNKSQCEVVLCAPDAGAAKRVKGVRDRVKRVYGHDLAIVMIDKTRKEANKIDSMVIIGDVKDKDVIIIDDMCDTAGTLCKAAEELKENGARVVNAIVTHGVLSGYAIHRLHKSVIGEFICSDSLPLPHNDMISVESVVSRVSINKQIAHAIKAINEHISVDELKQV